MAAVKISADMMKPFSGDGDVVSWITKIELVAKLTGVKDEAAFIPLYLEGGAFAVYSEMDETTRADAALIKKGLKEAFSDSMFAAYGKLVPSGYKWTGESVDVYANELRRLAGLAGFTGTALEHIVKLAFVAGFPDDVGVELQQMPQVESASMSQVIARARILTSNRSTHQVGASAVIGEKPRGYMRNVSGQGQGNNKAFSGKCFRCSGAHMIRDCPEREGKIVCYFCREDGHIASRCPKRNQGNC